MKGDSMSKLLNHYDYINQLKLRQSDLEEQVKRRKSTSDKNIEETLKINNRGNHNDYYLRKRGENTGKYIKKSNMNLVRSLAQQKYNACFVKEAEKELKVIRRFLNDYSDNIPNICHDFGLELKQSIDIADMSDVEFAEYWLGIPYKTKGISADIPEHITAKGERVRSKSEEIIANTLCKLKIPYKYECPIKLYNGEVIHPDFTILDVKNRRVFYYEHFGKMDDYDYFVRFVNRMIKFEKSGIYPGKNLIMTFESSQATINSQAVEKVLKKYIEL